MGVCSDITQHGLGFIVASEQSAILGHSKDEVQAVVDIRRPWKFGPGKHAYLTIPRASTTAVFQSRLFTIIWWDESHRRASFWFHRKKGLAEIFYSAEAARLKLDKRSAAERLVWGLRSLQ